MIYALNVQVMQKTLARATVLSSHTDSKITERVYRRKPGFFELLR